MNKIFLMLVIIFMTMTGAVGGFFLKKSSSGGLSPIALLKNKYIYIGGVIYVFTALLNVWVLKYMPYSVVLPMTAITYIWTMIISKLFLNEKITDKKMVGVISIIVGAIFISIY